MGRLHRTPDHKTALRAVWEQHIVWDLAVGPTGNGGGFRWANGNRIQPGNDLVAPYQLRDAGLIKVGEGTVSLTTAGLDRLAEWEQVAR